MVEDGGCGGGVGEVAAEEGGFGEYVAVKIHLFGFWCGGMGLRVMKGFVTKDFGFGGEIGRAHV